MDALYLIPGGVCLLLGSIFLLLFQRSRIEQEESDRRLTAEAWGSLTDVEERTEWDIDERLVTRYYGTYEYDTADRQHISSASASGYYSAEKIPGAQGELVKLLYDPNEPTKMAIPEERADALSVWPKFRKIGFRLLVLGGLLTAAAAAAMLGAFDPLIKNLLD